MKFEDRDRNKQERLAQEETQKHAQNQENSQKQAQESEPAHTTLPRSLESLHEQYQLPQYSLQNVLNGKFFTKTEFPNHWTVEKITQRAWDAYKYGIENPDANIFKRENTFSKILKIDDLEISIIVKKQVQQVVTL